MTNKELLERIAQDNRHIGQLAAEIERLRKECWRMEHEAAQSDLSVRLVTALLEHIRDGKKINAIKEIRAMTGVGLKDAKALSEIVFPLPPEVGA